MSGIVPKGYLSDEAVRRQLQEYGVPEAKIVDALHRLESLGPRPRKAVMKVPSKAVSQKNLFKRWCYERGLPQPMVDFRFMAHLPEGQRRNYELDYAWPHVDTEGGYAIECQGGVFRKGGGAHQGKGHLRDMEKMNLANRLGWTVDQVVPKDLFSAKTLELIKTGLAL